MLIIRLFLAVSGFSSLLVTLRFATTYFYRLSAERNKCLGDTKCSWVKYDPSFSKIWAKFLLVYFYRSCVQSADIIQFSFILSDRGCEVVLSYGMAAILLFCPVHFFIVVREVMCNQCGLEFLTVMAMRRHKRSSHNGKSCIWLDLIGVSSISVFFGSAVFE